MMINRRTAKRQIAASRSLQQLIRQHDIEIPNAQACEQLIDALERLRESTDALARETYQPPQQDDDLNEPNTACTQAA